MKFSYHAGMAEGSLNPAEKVASDLVHALCAANGLNDFFENTLPSVARLFSASRVVLIDYHESTNQFDVLHFVGYSERARFELQRGLRSMELQKALSQREPYYSGDDLTRLYLPLYFETLLEALI